MAKDVNEPNMGARFVPKSVSNMSWQNAMFSRFRILWLFSQVLDVQ
jgi:hypothetical protein